jgi:phosphohistidine phosphatase
MRTLYLLRHAQSDTPSGVDDVDRPLTQQGRQAASAMGKYLRTQHIQFDGVWCSSAVRALTTAQLLMIELSQPQSDLVEMPRMYEAADGDILDIVHTLPDTCHHALLVGHNPTLTNVVNCFIDDYIGSMPTCSLYAIAFYVDDWQAVTFGSGTCLFFATLPSNV